MDEKKTKTKKIKMASPFKEIVLCGETIKADKNGVIEISGQLAKAARRMGCEEIPEEA